MAKTPRKRPVHYGKDFLEQEARQRDERKAVAQEKLTDAAQSAANDAAVSAKRRNHWHVVAAIAAAVSALAAVAWLLWVIFGRKGE